jgi:hypothetical protein
LVPASRHTLATSFKKLGMLQGLQHISQLVNLHHHHGVGGGDNEGMLLQQLEL